MWQKTHISKIDSQVGPSSFDYQQGQLQVATVSSFSPVSERTVAHIVREDKGETCHWVQTAAGKQSECSLCARLRADQDSSRLPEGLFV